MKRPRWRTLGLALLGVIVLAIAAALLLPVMGARATLAEGDTEGASPRLVAPAFAWLPLVSLAKATSWPAGATPVAAPGLAVVPFASGLVHPRWVTALPNGDVLVAETNAPARGKPSGKGWLRSILDFSPHDWAKTMGMKRAGAFVPSPERITLLRDTDGDGRADLRTVLVGGLHTPFGMAVANGRLYVADTDALVSFPFTPGQTAITAPPTILAALPAGRNNHHPFKNVAASPDGRRLYVTIGSNSNVGEAGAAAEAGRAAIWEVDARTGAHRLFATGMRNPNGLAWEPASGALWATVNERDEIGSDLVPDYMTAVRAGQDYGWPWTYWGNHPDKRVAFPRPAALPAPSTPDYALGAHTASLGIGFARGAALGPAFAQGAFIGQHGSWNRVPRSGYKVVFVPFAGGRPVARAKPVDVLTGFLDRDGNAQGRPVGVAIDPAGGLLVADDVGNTVWRVTRAR